MNSHTADRTAPRRGPIDRLLGLFSDVQAGEGSRALLMLVNIFLILVCYYIIKTVREPLILSTEVPGFLQRLGIRGPAEVKTYASAGQALILMAFVPAYSWFASRVDRMKLIYGVTIFFAVNILAFAFLVDSGLEFIGIFFYVWVGFFSLSIIAQFWSYANDIHTKVTGCKWVCDTQPRLRGHLARPRGGARQVEQATGILSPRPMPRPGSVLGEYAPSISACNKKEEGTMEQAVH